jgi:D-aspartate ligase
MRDLSRHGLRVVGVDCDPQHAGFRSIYGKSYLCPNPDANPVEWVEFMKDLSRKLSAKPVIIPAADMWISALGRHAEALRDHYIFDDSGLAVQSALATKEQQYALAKQCGFPCPRTEYIQSLESLHSFASTARFPCLLKPTHQREWISLPDGNPLQGLKLVTAETPEELFRQYAYSEPYRPDLIVQEIIAGPDSAKYCYLSVYGRDGSRLGYCVVQEFRAHPILFGSASIVEPVRDEEIATLCDTFLRSIRYVGICEIEVKRDTRDQKVMLVEANPRFSGTADCAIYAGVELGWLHYSDLTGGHVVPVEPSRYHFRHITLSREIPSAIKYLQNGMITWRKLIHSYWIPLKFYDFDLFDWRVTGETLVFCLRHIVATILRKIGLLKSAKT